MLQVGVYGLLCMQELMEAEVMEAAQSRAGQGLLRKPAADNDGYHVLIEGAIRNLLKKCESLRARKRFFANKVEETNATGSPQGNSPAPSTQTPPAWDPLAGTPALHPSDPPPVSDQFQSFLLQMELDRSRPSSASVLNAQAQHGQHKALHKVTDEGSSQAATATAAPAAARQARQAYGTAVTWEAGVRAESGIALAIGPWAHTSSSLPVSHQTTMTVDLTSPNPEPPLPPEAANQTHAPSPYAQVPRIHSIDSVANLGNAATPSSQDAPLLADSNNGESAPHQQANGMATNMQTKQQRKPTQQPSADVDEVSAGPSRSANHGAAACVAAAADDDDDDYGGTSNASQVCIHQHPTFSKLVPVCLVMQCTRCSIAVSLHIQVPGIPSTLPGDLCTAEATLQHLMHIGTV